MEKLLTNVRSKVLPDMQTKDFYLCPSKTIDVLASQITPTSKNFGLLLAMDSESVDVGRIGHAAGMLMEKGLAYLCAWGRDCERVHDIFDETQVEQDPDLKSGVIMTTGHADQTLQEALHFFVNTAFPDQAYERTCNDWIVAPIGNREWERIIRNEFSLIGTDRTS